MRRGFAAMLALTLMVGCARFGYDPLHLGIDADAASHDAGDPNDGAMQESMDGASDAAAGGTGACAVTITMNTYLGSPRYHGWLSLQNAGATTWTTPTIQFDLPSSAHVCNDADILPGAGWTLQSSAGHAAERACSRGRGSAQLGESTIAWSSYFTFVANLLVVMDGFAAVRNCL